jgi:hypothetical protein
MTDDENDEREPRKRLTDEAVEREIREKLAVRKPVAFRALRLGRRAGKAAVDAGLIPIIAAAGTVPTPWLRQQLLLTGDSKT